METAKSFSPSATVEYSANAVVSKTILKKPGGNISLFSFDKGEGLAEHSSPHEVMVEIIDGTAEITIGGNLHHLHAGECIILPANVPHALRAVERFKMVLTMIKS